MTTRLEIRRLRPDDAGALMSLRQQALVTDPLSFRSSPGDDRLRSPEFVRARLADGEEQAVFGGFDGARLVGMVGVIRESAIKERHKARLWGLYVAPAARGQQLGRALLTAAIGRARQWTGVDQLQLSVTTAAGTAKRLYEAAGFVCWGCEPLALVWLGQSVDELHYALDLKTGAS